MKSFWNNNHARQEEYNVLAKSLVRVKRESLTLHGELLRAIGNLYYEWGNNGNGNAVDFKNQEQECDNCEGQGSTENFLTKEQDCCEWCNGDGYTEERGDIFIVPRYRAFVDLLKTVDDESGSAIEDFLLSDKHTYTEDEYMILYDNMVCKVLDYIRDNEDEDFIDLEFV